MRIQNPLGGNTFTYLHTDHLRSSAVSTDSSGAVTSNGRQSYYPYGDLRTAGTMPTDIGFTGQRLDATGLMFYGARACHKL